MRFRIQVNTLDCVGCGSCVEVCPGLKGEKALAVKPLETQLDPQVDNHRFSESVPNHADVLNTKTVSRYLSFRALALVVGKHRT
jgi:pyruvate-ferredoxin/flavodoxin oxidoreductase